MSGTSNHPSSYPVRPRPSLFRHVVVLIAVAMLSVLGIGSAAAEAQPGAGQAPPVTNPQARAADLARPAVVWIRVHYDAWVITDFGTTYRTPVDLGCSGFIVNPNGYIVSAGHCFDDGMEGAQGDAITQVVDELVEQGRVPFYLRDQLIEDVKVGNVDWQVEGKYNDSRPDRKVYVTVGGGSVKWGKVNAGGAKPARVVEALNVEEGDAALLKLERTGLPSILLSPTNDIEVGEELLSIGYPAETDGEESFGLTNRNGQINAEVPKGPGNLPFYETSARLTQGMSGGPTVGLEGQVLGLASFKNEDADYIVPSSIIQELLTRNGVRNELGRLDQLYRQGLESFYRHEYSAAINSFDQVLALMSGHRLAAAKKAKAAELRERFGDPTPPPPPDEPGLSTRVLLAGAAAVLIVLAAAAWLVLRRRARERRRTRRAPGPEQFPEVTGWDDAGPPPAPQASGASEEVMAGRADRDGIDPHQGMHVEPRHHNAPSTGSDPIGDLTWGDGSVRDGGRSGAPVSVQDPETTTGSHQHAGPAVPTRRFCFNCGSPVLPDDPSCRRCGTRLG
jgi:serine protease Do